MPGPYGTPEEPRGIDVTAMLPARPLLFTNRQKVHPQVILGSSSRHHKACLRLYLRTGRDRQQLHSKPQDEEPLPLVGAELGRPGGESAVAKFHDGAVQRRVHTKSQFTIVAS